MEDFNYRGVVFQVQLTKEDEDFVMIEAVYHKGVDLTEVLDVSDMEERLNEEIKEGHELARAGL